MEIAGPNENEYFRNEKIFYNSIIQLFNDLMILS